MIKAEPNRLSAVPPWLAWLVLLLVSQVSPAQVLYNINFNTPDQGVNQLVRTGAAPQYVTSIVYGSPQVVAAFGGLTNQPLCLNMVSNQASFYYDQIRLNLPRLQSPTLDVAFDFTSAGLLGSAAQLAVLFDTPTVRNVYFQNNGVLSLTQPLRAPTSVGSFTDGESFHVDIHVDLAQHQWSLFKDGVLLGSTPFNPDDYIRDIRFSYGLVLGSSTPDGSAVAIDNLSVTVPEPSAAALLLLGAGLCWRRKTARAPGLRMRCGVRRA